MDRRRRRRSPDRGLQRWRRIRPRTRGGPRYDAQGGGKQRYRPDADGQDQPHGKAGLCPAGVRGRLGYFSTVNGELHYYWTRLPGRSFHEFQVVAIARRISMPNKLMPTSTPALSRKLSRTTAQNTANKLIGRGQDDMVYTYPVSRWDYLGADVQRLCWCRAKWNVARP